jgi:hypothetical protein
LEGKSLEICNWTLACYAIHYTIYCRHITACTVKLYVLAAASLIAQFSVLKIDPRRENPTTDKFAHCIDSVFKDSDFKELGRYEKVPNRCEPLTMDMIDALYQRNKQEGLQPFHCNVHL